MGGNGEACPAVLKGQKLTSSSNGGYQVGWTGFRACASHGWHASAVHNSLLQPSSEQYTVVMPLLLQPLGQNLPRASNLIPAALPIQPLHLPEICCLRAPACNRGARGGDASHMQPPHHLGQPASQRHVG
jgi:hypothetical protein